MRTCWVDISKLIITNNEQGAIGEDPPLGGGRGLPNAESLPLRGKE